MAILLLCIYNIYLVVQYSVVEEPVEYVHPAAVCVLTIYT